MEQHNKFTSLLPKRAKAATEPTPIAKAIPTKATKTIERKYLPVKQEQTHSFPDKNCKQEASNLRIQFKQENSTDANDSDENLLEVMESSWPEHIVNDVEPLFVDPNEDDANYEASEDKQEDEEVQLIEEEYNVFETNEFEEEHLDEDPAEPTEYAYEPQAFENEFFKSIHFDKSKPGKKSKPSNRTKLENAESKEDEAYDEIEFIDDDETFENEEDTAYDDTLNTPKKTTTIVGNQRKIAYQCRQCLKVFPTLAKFLQHM